MQKFRKYAVGVVVTVAVLFPFVFFSSAQTARRDLSVFERMVVAVSMPIQAALSGALGVSRSFFERYIDVVQAKQEAFSLRRENQELKVKLQLLHETASENVRLRGLLHFLQQVDVGFVAGEVVGGDPSFLYKSIRLNRGSDQGVLPGMSVVAAEGAVGVVIRATAKTCDVLLLSDPNANIDVIVVRNRRRGVLEGSVGNLLRFKYTDRGSRVHVGDTIITSGLTGAFPRGIKVGQVSKVSVEADGVTQAIEVEPSVDVSQLTEALILLLPSREIDIIRKVGGEDWMKHLMETAPVRMGG